jgi:hypothetical protein
MMSTVEICEPAGGKSRLVELCSQDRRSERQRTHLNRAEMIDVGRLIVEFRDELSEILSQYEF